jgi:hypothetical protein
MPRTAVAVTRTAGTTVKTSLTMFNGNLSFQRAVSNTCPTVQASGTDEAVRGFVRPRARVGRTGKRKVTGRVHARPVLDAARQIWRPTLLWPLPGWLRAKRASSTVYREAESIPVYGPTRAYMSVHEHRARTMCSPVRMRRGLPRRRRLAKLSVRPMRIPEHSRPT